MALAAPLAQSMRTRRDCAGVAVGLNGLGGEPGFVVGAQLRIAGEDLGREAGFVVLVGGEQVDVLEDFGFDLLLDLIGEFHAVGAEELDAVVLPGIVGGGDDDAGGEAVGAGEVGDAGGGEHAGAGKAASGVAQAAGQGFSNPGGGFAGVLPEDDPGAGGAAHQAGAAGASDGVDGGVVEGIFAGDAANSVGSKQLPDVCPGRHGQVSGPPFSGWILR